VSGTFSARTDELRRQTRCDRGTLTGSVEVDQVYAHVQHEHLEYKHPRGGQARYLAAGLEASYRDYLQAIADGVLDDGGLLHHQVKLFLGMPGAALILVASGVRMEFFETFRPGRTAEYADILLTIFWVVAIAASRYSSTICEVTARIGRHIPPTRRYHENTIKSGLWWEPGKSRSWLTCP